MKAIFIGHQFDLTGDSFALFNIECPGNELHRSTVTAETLKKLGIRQLYDGDGQVLLTVPLPFCLSRAIVV